VVDVHSRQGLYAWVASVADEDKKVTLREPLQDDHGVGTCSCGLIWNGCKADFYKPKKWSWGACAVS
jgi:hypothetical protein